MFKLLLSMEEETAIGHKNFAKRDFKNFNDCTIAFGKMKKGLEIEQEFSSWGLGLVFFFRRRWPALPTALQSTNNKSTSSLGFVSSLMKHLPSGVQHVEQW